MCARHSKVVKDGGGGSWASQTSSQALYGSGQVTVPFWAQQGVIVWAALESMGRETQGSKGSKEEDWFARLGFAW